MRDLVAITLMGAVPTLLILLFALALVAVGRGSRLHDRRGSATAAGLFSAVMVAGLASVCWFWGVGFDYVDSDRTAPAYVDRLMTTGFWTAVAAYFGVLVTGALAHRGHRHHAARP